MEPVLRGKEDSRMRRDARSGFLIFRVFLLKMTWNGKKLMLRMEEDTRMRRGISTFLIFRVFLMRITTENVKNGGRFENEARHKKCLSNFSNLSHEDHLTRRTGRDHKGMVSQDPCLGKDTGSREDIA